MRFYKMLEVPRLLLSKLDFKKGANSHNFLGFDIPLELIALTGGNAETFDEITRHHRKLLDKNLKLGPEDRVLELGCGMGRDAIHLAKLAPTVKSYLGVDIIKESISWATQNITKKHKNFVFHHFDIKDQLHNPDGVLDAKNIGLPAKNESIDKIFLWSVFTHMPEDLIIHYLKEFRRVLTKDGIGFASCFIVNKDVLHSASRVNLTPYDLKFNHLYGDGCYINNLEFPMGAVAYTEEKIDEFLWKAGLVRESEFFRGSWSGHWENYSDGQDGFCFKVRV